MENLPIYKKLYPQQTPTTAMPTTPTTITPSNTSSSCHNQDNKFALLEKYTKQKHLLLASYNAIVDKENAEISKLKSEFGSCVETQKLNYAHKLNHFYSFNNLQNNTEPTESQTVTSGYQSNTEQYDVFQNVPIEGNIVDREHDTTTLPVLSIEPTFDDLF